MDRGLSTLRHAGALLDFSMPPCGTTSPSATCTAPGPDWQWAPAAKGRGSLGPGWEGGGGLDTCCKSTAQTVQTRAVNQQARTITPKEAKTLLSVNTHHNSRLFNLDRTGSNLRGLSAQYLSQTEKLHYLMRTNSIIHDRILARAQWEMFLSKDVAIYQKFTYSINVFLDPGDTRFSVQRLR